MSSRSRASLMFLTTWRLLSASTLRFLSFSWALRRSFSLRGCPEVGAPSGVGVGSRATPFVVVVVVVVVVVLVGAPVGGFPPPPPLFFVSLPGFRGGTGPPTPFSSPLLLQQKKHHVRS